MTGVLVTGFEPFGKNEVNPSELIAEELGGVVLPVSYARAGGELQRALDERDPEIVIAFGLADDRETITPERFAHNLDEATTTDNDEAPGSGEAIDPDGPAAYASSLPVDELVEALRAEGIPAAPSRDAGGFLCNHVFYVLMRPLEQERPSARGGFVHVPRLPEQALATDEPSMPLETLVRAAGVIVGTCAPQRSAS